ncbi:MAG: recX [Candidatus Berkelbacteria bacterium]|nr:recX [Candidatus Berkelbacteria bacterium]
MKKDALNIALHFLKFRPRSVFEIETKLKSKNISESEIKKVINVFKKNQLLDDTGFAKMWIRDRNLFKPSGSFLLKIELRRFGIAEDIIENVLANQDNEELAKQALESKGRLIKAEFIKKAAFLQRRGFSTNIIYKILK